jgi:hypothetical protein
VKRVSAPGATRLLMRPERVAHGLSVARAIQLLSRIAFRVMRGVMRTAAPGD